MVAISRNLKSLIYLISPDKIYPKFYIELDKVLASKKVSFFQLRLKNKSLNRNNLYKYNLYMNITYLDEANDAPIVIIA